MSLINIYTKVTSHIEKRKANFLNDEPAYGGDYRIWLGLLSTWYIRRYYQLKVADCPSLSDSAEFYTSMLVRFALRHRKSVNQTLLLIAVTYVVCFRLITHADPKSAWYGFLIFISFVICISLELGIFVKVRRTVCEELAAQCLFIAIYELDHNDKNWNVSKFRWHIASRLEEIAKAIERLPFSIGKVGLIVRQKTWEVSRSKAAGIRQLEIEVICSSELTLDLTTGRLVTALTAVLEGRWYDLPDADYNRIVPKWITYLQVLAVIVALGLAVTVTIFTGKLGGPAASLLTTIIITVAIGVLNFSGIIPFGAVERSAQLGTTLTSRR